MNFYEFPIPSQINGGDLKAHLGADEVYLREDKLVIGSDTLTLDQVTAGLASYVYAAPVDVRVQAIADAKARGWSDAMIAWAFP